jgi:5,10-methylenetetrahydromethanopterin reductase
VFAGSVNLIPEAPIADIVRLAQLAENLGFNRCWVYDEGLATRDVYVTLTAIAAATESIKLGTGITNPFTRHPSTTAASIASLDEFSGGRAFLGLGAGGSLTLDPLGIDRAHPLSAVRDTLTACRGLFSGESVSVRAGHFQLKYASLGYARADTEIWVGGRGPKMLQLGGELADGVMLDSLHTDVVADSVALVHEGAMRSGNRPQLIYSTMVVTDEASMAVARAHMKYRLIDSQPKVQELLGITELDIARIRRAMSGGLEAAGEHVKEDWVRPFVLIGSVDECASQLAALVERHGIDEFLVPVLDLPNAAATISMVSELLAKV